jgi:acyl-coenzyme A thioesterase PaaI-like protein
VNAHWLVDRIRTAAQSQAAVLPVHAAFGVRAIDARPGHSEFGQAMGPWLLDGHGRLCPGAFLVAADAALGSAVATTLTLDTTVMSLTIHAQFVTLDPGRAGDFTVTGDAVEIGARSGFSIGTIVDDHGRVIARISTHCGFMTGIPTGVAPPPLPAADAWSPDPATESGESLLAPIARRRTQARVLEGSDDSLLVGAVSTPGLRNSRGDLQGGVLGMLAEQGITACLVRDSPPMATADTMDLDITFLRPVRAEAPEVEITARSEHAGRRFALARADGRDGAGRLVVSASGSRYAP